jgi:hypothetical protein
MTEIRVAALYHFARLDDYRELQAPLLEKCLAEDIRGWNDCRHRERRRKCFGLHPVGSTAEQTGAQRVLRR